jgi:predicted nucleic acid-binding protein
VTAKVCDASAIAAILFGEPGFEQVAARFQDTFLIAPSLLSYEIANIATKKARRRTDDITFLIQAVDKFAAMEIQFYDVAAPDAFALARSLGLSGYDASYLWLARRLNIELVTLDKQLQRAADVAA